MKRETEWIKKNKREPFNVKISILSQIVDNVSVSVSNYLIAVPSDK